ncbi:MAG: N-formylglutamate amidohydrolase [Alphaproteobacteria bacterium]|nr:N-formylglutamate amidohydrolase [Alphaproteobacteria bacterium]
MDDSRPFLTPDDPAPVVEIPAARETALVIVCDHAGRAVPRELGDMGVPPAEWERHIAWDIGAFEVSKRLAARFGCGVVASVYSRLVIDCNRRLDDPGLCPEISDGTPVPANMALSQAERARRIAALHVPYHDAVRRTLGAMRARGLVPVVVSMHSCTPVFKGFERPWHIGVLWKSDPRLPKPLMARLAGMDGVNVGDNEPYDARDGHGFTMGEHCERAGLPHALIEIRQDLIDTRAGCDRWAAVFGDALETLAERPEMGRIEVHP